MAVLRLLDYDDNNQRRTVEDMLTDCLQNQEILEDFPKAVIIFVNDVDGYSVAYDSAKMFRPEIVAALEAAKIAFLRVLMPDKEF